MSQHVANYASHEGLLHACLIELFPGEKILANSLKAHEFKHTDTGEYMELDAWIPNLNICFEFQDAYHYVTAWYDTPTLEKIKQRDNSKQTVLHHNRISLLTIPCWWDGTTGSLSNTIHHHRPDLLPANSSDLIPLNPSVNYFITPDIPNVSELMLASFAPEHFSPAPFEWWIGEKYDGVRFYWDALTRVAYSRNGREINILATMKLLMPHLIMDCELWYGRGQFSLSYAMVSKSIFFSWDFLRVVAFDALPLTTLEVPFEERYSDLTRKIPNNHPFVTAAFRALCCGSHHMRTFADEIIQKGGGEGLIFRRVASHYEPGRSPSLLKLKTALGDQEAIVIDIEEDGSLELKLPNGKTFRVPRDDVHVDRPSLGDIVTFSYYVNTRHDIPTRPSVFRIRTDLDWDDVIISARSDRHRVNDVFQTKPLHYWTEVNLRKHLEQFARSLNLDPLEASTWSTINPTKLLDMKGGHSVGAVLSRGRFHKNIQALFPEVDFQDQTFVDLQDPNARRTFFVNYARKKGFDPLIPDNWYNQVKTSIAAEKGGTTVLELYGKKLENALPALFPEIGLDKSRFNIYKWKDESNRRVMLEDFAKANSFDPLKAGHWESVSQKRLFQFSEAAKYIVRTYYNGSLRIAVMALFPEIGHFDMRNVSRNTRDQMRTFFETFAKKRRFDPLTPERWYKQTATEIYAEKGATEVMEHYEKDYRLALVDLFPAIGLKYSDFTSKHIDLQDPISRRSFFVNYARKKGFDPLIPDNWYSQVKRSVTAEKGGTKLLTLYGKRLHKALMALFPEIGLDKSKFKTHKWKDESRRRAVLEDFAKSNHFDPLKAEHWQSVSFLRLFQFSPAARSIITHYYNGSLTTAVMALFPEIDHLNHDRG